METQDQNYNLTKPYIWNFEKEIWMPFYPFMLNTTKTPKVSFIDKTFKKYDNGCFLTNEFETEEQKFVYSAFKNQDIEKNELCFRDYCLQLLNDYGHYIEISDRHKFIRNKKIYVKNCSYCKLPYNLNKLKNHPFIQTFNIEIVENKKPPQ